MITAAMTTSILAEDVGAGAVDKDKDGGKEGDKDMDKTVLKQGQ